MRFGRFGIYGASGDLRRQDLKVCRIPSTQCLAFSICCLLVLIPQGFYSCSMPLVLALQGVSNVEERDQHEGHEWRFFHQDSDDKIVLCYFQVQVMRMKKLFVVCAGCLRLFIQWSIS